VLAYKGVVWVAGRVRRLSDGDSGERVDSRETIGEG